jgi:hypothetical protein
MRARSIGERLAKSVVFVIVVIVALAVLVALAKQWSKLEERFTTA